MSVHSFKRLTNHPNDHAAVTLAEDLCQQLQASRTGREDQPSNTHESGLMQGIASLMVGRHAPVVIPVVTRYYPQLVQLLLRQVGIVERLPDLETASPGLIATGLGGFTWHQGAVRLGALTVGARVSFFPTDDGCATQIDLLETDGHETQ